MTDLVLGPILRWVGTDAATIWMETDGPATVAILGQESDTFEVGGHHFAIVVLRGLDPGRTYEYEVALDAETRWPLDGAEMPASRIRTRHGDDHLTVAFGSCRVAGPRTAPLGIDRLLRRYDPALDAMAEYGARLASLDPDSWPDLLLLLGDQVYADNAPEASVAYARGRRDVSQPPGEAMADFEEYTRLYRDSWSEPRVRWLLSTVPSAMVFDDHELIDDWQISRAKMKEVEAAPDWDDRLAGALMGYWLYQHLGNLSPDELEADPLYDAVRAHDDGLGELRRALVDDDPERPGSRWSYERDYGDVRVVVLDARATRVLADGRRDIMDDAEWEKLDAALRRPGARHIVLASSVPVFYAEGFHHIQAWSERVAAGAWGRRAVEPMETVRRALSLAGWPAFATSFARLMASLEAAGRGIEGSPPASITILSGDVHHGYVARVDWPARAGVRSAMHQVVCSPLRNPLSPPQRFAQRLAASRLGGALLRGLAASAGTKPPGVAWKRLEGLEFANQISTLSIASEGVSIVGERVVHRGSGGSAFDVMWRRTLVDDAPSSSPR